MTSTSTSTAPAAGGGEVAAPTVAEIGAAVDAVFDESVQTLLELVAIDSTLSNEAPAQEFMAKQFEQLGATFSVERQAVSHDDLKSKRGYSPADWSYDGRFNVVARHEPPAGATAKKTLILNGHIDVVPTGPAAMWTRPPFDAYVKDGRLYGRGSGDMKAGVVAMLYAIKALQRLGLVPASRVQLQTVIEEEITGNGALAVVGRDGDAASHADAVLIPEPFGESIVTAQLGVMWFRLVVRGKPAHVLDTSAGSNAIESAMYLFDAVRALERELNQSDRKHAAYSGLAHPVCFNLGIARGGEWASSVPCECALDVRVGFYPGTAVADMQARVEALIAAAAAARNLAYHLEYRGFQAEGCVFDADSDFFKRLGAAHRAVSGREPVYAPVTCTTDARFFWLYRGIPATCYGPEAKTIHGIDESVSLDSMRTVIKGIAAFVVDWCGVAKSP